VGQIALEILRNLVSCVRVSEYDVNNGVQGILYKFSLLNKPELNKVYHSLYNFFLGRIQGVKLGDISENTLSNIIYKIKVFQELNNCIN
jgi:lysyl-tRNA synthetase class I